MRAFQSLRYKIGTTPQLINDGDCWLWALLAQQAAPKAILMFAPWPYGGGHAFVKVGRRYYDAEKTCGVREWRMLPACADCDDPSPEQEARIITRAELLAMQNEDTYLAEMKVVGL